MILFSLIDIKTEQYALEFARNKRLRAYYYNRKTIVLDKHYDNKDGIRKSNYSSISIPLKFQAFQDCLNFKINYDYHDGNRSVKVKFAVGCHFVKTNQTSFSSMSFDNNI